MVPLKIPNPLDPFYHWSKDAWGWVESLTAMLISAILHPEELLDYEEKTLTIFLETWGLAIYIASAVFVVLVVAAIFAPLRASIPALKALVIGMVIGIGGKVVLELNKAMLDFGRGASKIMLELGPANVPMETTTGVFPEYDPGLGAFLLYAFDSILLGILLLIAVAFVFLQIVTSILVLPSLSLWQFGEFGRVQFRIVITAWLICFMGGLPLIAFFVRMGQLASTYTADENVGSLISYLSMSLAIILVIALFYIFIRKSVEVARGSIDADVDGDVDSDVDGEVDAELDDDIDADIDDSDDNNNDGDYNPDPDNESHDESDDYVKSGDATIGDDGESNTDNETRYPSDAEANVNNDSKADFHQDVDKETDVNVDKSSDTDVNHDVNKETEVSTEDSSETDVDANVDESSETDVNHDSPDVTDENIAGGTDPNNDFESEVDNGEETD